jgi:uncharacterized cysteine cluster protein YcgN (CxxCxxCC family)
MTKQEIRENIKKLQSLNQKEWEQICKGCGICCLNKIEFSNRMYFSAVACDHLNTETKRCDCYECRLLLSSCGKVDIRALLESRQMPDSCAYAERIFGPAKYPAIVDWAKVDHECPHTRSSLKTFAKIIKGSSNWASDREFKMEEI